MSEDNRVFNPVQLQEKNIEPSRRNQQGLNRNFQLGNIPKNSFKSFSYQAKRSVEFGNFPHDFGGFLTQKYAEEKLKTNELLMVMSGSIEGFVRVNNNTFQTNQKLEQTQKGALSGMFSKK